MAQWVSWYEGLQQQGRVKGSNPLFPEGKVVSGKKGRVVADGPFAESKEAIGGYFLIEAAEHRRGRRDRARVAHPGLRRHRGGSARRGGVSGVLRPARGSGGR